MNRKPFSDNVFSSSQLSSGPVGFWFLNDRLEKDILDEQLDEFARQGFSGIVIHPRDGLDTPYLTESWFQMLEYILNCTCERSLDAWFYDECPYPSGTAGGHLLNRYPHLVAQTLVFNSQHVVANQGLVRLILPGEGRLLRVFAVPVDDNDQPILPFQDVTSHAGLLSTHWNVCCNHNNGYLPSFADEESELHWRAVASCERWTLHWPVKDSQRYLILSVRIAEGEDLRHGKYVDLLNPETTQRFVELTYEATVNHIGSDNFKKFKAAFTDEAKLCPPYPWTPSLPEDYRQAYGQELWDILPHLYCGTDPQSQLSRLRYRRLLGDLWRDRFVRPLARWCEAHGIPLTGHFSPEEDPIWQTLVTPGWTDITAELHWPGFDQITSLIGIGLHNHRCLGPKLTSSLVHQRGHEHIMSEALGVSGEGLTIERMKKTIDWLAVCGSTDKFVFHGQFMSLDGHRKREAPPSIFFQAPYWQHMHKLSDYIHNLTGWFNRGKPYRPIAILYPTAAFEAWVIPQNDKATYLAQHLGNLVGRLAMAGLDFDMIADRDLPKAKLIQIDGRPMLQMGKAVYETLVLPNVQILDEATAQSLVEFCSASLQIQSLTTTVSIIGTSDQIQKLPLPHSQIDDLVNTLIHQHRTWLNVPSEQAIFVNSQYINDELQRLIWNPNETPIPIIIAGSELDGYFSFDGSSPHSIRTISPDKWQIELEPWQSLVVCNECVGARKLSPTLPSTDSKNTLRTSNWSIKPHSHNDLVLSHWRLQLATGQEHTVCLPAPSGRLPWGLDGEIVTMTCEVIINELFDQASLLWDRSTFGGTYQLQINGQIVPPPQHIRKKDIHERLVPIGDFLQTGANRLEIKIGPVQTHKPAMLDPLHLTGWFKVKRTSDENYPAEITRIRKEIPIEVPQDWTQLGFPHYSGTMSYRCILAINSVEGRYFLKIPACQDGLEVFINDASAGTLCWQPYYLEITQFLKSGNNTVSIQVSNTSINRLEAMPQPSGLFGPLSVEIIRNPVNERPKPAKLSRRRMTK